MTGLTVLSPDQATAKTKKLFTAIRQQFNFII